MSSTSPVDEGIVHVSSLLDIDYKKIPFVHGGADDGFRLLPKRPMLQWKIIFLGLVNLSPPVVLVAPFRILC